MRNLWTVALAALLCSGARARTSEASPWSEKPVGILLVAETGGGDWNRFVGDAKKAFGRGVPLEQFSGALGTRGLQRAVDRLQREKVERIIVVPVVLDSAVPETEQLGYLFGAREHPSKAFLKKWRMGRQLVKRVKTKVPVVITGGIDGHDALGKILLERSLEMSRDPSAETVILVGAGSQLDEENNRLGARIESLAGRVAILGGFSAARGILILPSTDRKPRRRDESLRALRGAIRDASTKRGVIVVPYMLLDDGSVRTWKKNLDNLFFRWRGKTLLPDEALLSWLKVRVDGARAAENMVKFKDEGHLSPPEKPRSKIVP
jgi:hypothetical protein